jgi:hypothetical protein
MRPRKGRLSQRTKPRKRKSGDMSPRILNLGTRWMSLVSFRSRPYAAGEWAQICSARGSCARLRADLGAVQKRKICQHSKAQIPSRPARGLTASTAPQPQGLAELQQTVVTGAQGTGTTAQLRIKYRLFWNVAPCCWTRVSRRFVRMQCLYLISMGYGIQDPATWRLLHKAPPFVQQRETRHGEQQPPGGELTFRARLLCAEPLIPCTVGSAEPEPWTRSNSDSRATFLHKPDSKRLYGVEDWLRMWYKMGDRLWYRQVKLVSECWQCVCVCVCVCVCFKVPRTNESSLVPERP